MDRGTYVEHDGHPAVRFRRSYPHPVERVWAAITGTDELAHWFPSKVVLEQRVGGVVEFSGDPHIADSRGTVLAIDPPRRLAYTWGDDELHFELAPESGGGSVLTLINVLGTKDAAARNAAGWSICLAALDDLLDGLLDGRAGGVSSAGWQEHYDAYVAAGMPAGAPIPSS